MEKDLRRSVVNLPAQSRVWSCLGNLFHFLTVVVEKKLPLYVHICISCFQLSLLSLLPATHHCEEFGSSFLTASLQVCGGCCWVPLKLSFLQVGQPSSYSLYSQSKCSES